MTVRPIRIPLLTLALVTGLFATSCSTEPTTNTGVGTASEMTPAADGDGGAARNIMVADNLDAPLAGATCRAGR